MKRYDMSKCALCYEAPCDRLCPQIRPSAVLRSIWLGNEKWAAGMLPEYSMCMNCRGLCEQECIRPGEVPIRELMNRLYMEVRPALEIPVPDDLERLRTEICGVPLENPFLLSSSVVSSTYDMCARALKQAGQELLLRQSVHLISVRRRPGFPLSAAATVRSSDSRT